MIVIPDHSSLSGLIITMIADEEDLYDDLDQVKPASGSRPTKNATSLSLENLVKELEVKLEALSQENNSLKRNIGTLFRTARAEIRRKDAEIETLHKKLETGR